MMVPNGFTDWAKPIGTGAFVVDAFDPGVRVALKKPGKYWKADRGYLDAVEFNVINDTSARMNALISGQVDAINRADPKTVSRIEKSPTLEIVRAAGGWYPVMAMMVDRDPYSNLELRQALKYAVDREQMIKTLFSGYGTLGNDTPIPRSDPYFNSQMAQLKYDPEKAKFHFKKAGLDGPQDHASDLGCGVQRRRRHGDAVAGHPPARPTSRSRSRRSRPTAISTISGSRARSWRAIGAAARPRPRC